MIIKNKKKRIGKVLIKQFPPKENVFLPIKNCVLFKLGIWEHYNFEFHAPKISYSNIKVMYNE